MPLICTLKHVSGNSLVVQWLGLCAFTSQGLGSLPGLETKILQTVWHGPSTQKKIVNFMLRVF